MRSILTILILCFAVNLGFAQKVKFKKSKVIIDKVECFKYENEGSTTTLYDMNDEEIISFEYVQVTSYDPKNAAGFDVHFDTYFAESDTRVNLKFSGRKKFIKSLIKFKVLKNCTLDKERLKKFINKYSL